MNDLNNTQETSLELDNLSFTDIFNLDNIQRMQDLFSDATGVASIITQPDGIPITKPSNFCRLCSEIIRKTEKGCANCFKSDAILGCYNPTGPLVQPCLSGGLWDAGASISIGGKHIANWLIGQVRNEEIDDHHIMAYADEIGADRTEFQNALNEVPVMSASQFRKVAKMLFAYANELSEKAYSNLQLKQQIIEKENSMVLMHQSQEHFRQIVETSVAGILSLDSHATITFANQKFAKMTGYSAEELIGMNFSCFLPENPLYPYQELTIKGLRDKDSIYEKCIKTKNGEYIWTLVSANVLLNSKGKFEGSYAMFVDITERIHMEEELRSSEERFRMIVEGAPDPIFIQSDFKFEYLNQPALNLFGATTPEDLIGKHIMERFHPDFHERIYTRIHSLTKELRPVTTLLEQKFIRLNGEEVWVETRGEPIIYNGKKGGLVFVRDITERRNFDQKLRNNEEKLNTLFNSMKEMVVLHEVVFNNEGKAVNYRIIDCNKAYSEITGIKREDAIGKLATEVYQSETPPYLEEFTQVGITGIPYEYTTYYQPMDKHFFISVVSPSKNTFATITNDITAIIQIQEVIQSKNKELENYLYVASHDLRSPLVNIQGFCMRLQRQTNAIKDLLYQNDLLKEEEKVEVQRIINENLPKTLQFIFSNVEKMDGLINGLLQISRTGRIELHIKKVDMNQMLETIISSYNYQITDWKVNIELEKIHDCYGDEGQLNQLFSNIIGNALKYRDSERPLTITISSVSQYNKVIYKIQDTGVGIMPKFIDKIWDVFFRVEPTGKKEGEGIGLCIAKRIVEKHNGKIWVESHYGVGTIVYIELNKREF